MSAIDDKILEFDLNCALHDAVVQQAYNGKKPKLADLMGGTKITTYDKKVCDVFEMVKEFVNLVISGGFLNKTQDDYDEQFYNVAIDIQKYMHANKFSLWSFGNSQKLINMTFKYLYPITYANTSMSARFSLCHCPEDYRMLKHACDEIHEKVCPASRRMSAKAIADYIGDAGVESYTATEFLSAWSNENIPAYKDFKYSRYNTFQRAIRIMATAAKLSPLEYDFIAW